MTFRFTSALFVCLFATTSFASGPAFEPMSRMPSELSAKRTASVSAGALNIENEVSFPELKFRELRGGELAPVLPETRVFTLEKMPEVPVFMRKLALPDGYSATVRFEDVELEQSTAPVNLHKAEDVHVWSGNHEAFVNAKLPEGRYFPGKLFDARESNGTLHLMVYPMQWDRESGKVVMMRSARVKLDLVKKLRALFSSSARIAGTDAVIVTTESLKSAAEKLRDYQTKNFEVTSEIVTVESIDKNEKPIAETDLPNGYKSGKADHSVVKWDATQKTGYNYGLARKIVTYLQKRMGDGTKYVTLLGDATLVPPSYYSSIRGSFNSEYTVTDQCYAAKNQCLDPQLAVGRLPFKSEAELDNYLSKLTRWLSYAKDTDHELSLYGGKAFQGDVFIGELGTLRTLNSEKADWRGVQKFYRTRKTYDRDHMLALVQGKANSSFVYHLDHGNGNQWYVEGKFVSSKEIAEAADAGPVVNPVVVSIACTDAAFDETLTKEKIFAGDSYGKESVGVSMLKSKAGAVAYLGSARPALGTPSYQVDASGNLSITGASYGLQLLDTFYEKYGAAKEGHLGDFVLKATRAYVFEHGNDMSLDNNLWTYYIAELLGDPTVKLPKRERLEKGWAQAKSTTVFRASDYGFPEFFLGSEKKALSVAFEAPSKISATLLKMVRSGFSSGEEKVLEKAYDAGKSAIELKDESLSAGDYQLRLESAEGVPVERQVWFTVSEKE